MQNKIKRIFITGGTGFFGKNLVPKLIKDGYDVTLFKGDLRNEQEVFQAINSFKPEVVYHMGGLVDLSRTYEIAQKIIDINIRGITVLLEALRNFPPTRFIYTSTEEIYGNNALPFSENQLPKPPSFYAVSKIASEQLTTIYSKLCNYEIIILRIGTAYGPHQPATRLIPQITLNALRNQNILLNSGKKKRDYIFVKDVVDALIKSSSCKLSSKINICNVGGGKQYSLKTLAESILNIAKSKSKVICGAYPDRILEADEWLLDNTNAKKILDWRPTTSLEEGLKQTIKFYKNHLTEAF